MQSAYRDQYEQLYRTHWWWRAREAYVLRWIQKVVDKRGMEILDIGSGDGLLWAELKKYGNVEGIEPDGRLVPDDSTHRSRIEIASFPEGRRRNERYDLILMLDVLEHIEDDFAAMRVVKNLLTSSGYLILTVPALMFLWSDFDVINGHYRRYRKNSLRKLLDDVGLRIVCLRYYYFWTVLPLSARRLLFKSKNTGNSQFLKAPPAAINRFLLTASNVDHYISSIVPMPVGSSLIAVARNL